MAGPSTDWLAGAMALLQGMPQSQALPALAARPARTAGDKEMGKHQGLVPPRAAPASKGAQPAAQPAAMLAQL